MKDGVFLSYRKDDTKDVAHHIADRLKHHFGEQHVFLDVVDIAVGDAWMTRIQDALSRSAVLVALIGKAWIDIRDKSGLRRLDDPNDVVRKELETVLNSDTPVISVRIHGAPMPAAGELPPSLHRLLAVQGDSVRADDISNETFDDDCDRLVRNISRIISARRQPPRGMPRAPIGSAAGQRSKLVDAMRQILTSPHVPPRIVRRLAADPFLRQDPLADLSDYSAERPVAPYLPYVEVINWCREVARGERPEISVKLLRGDFKLASWGPGDGDAICEQALEAALVDKPKTFNGPAVRIEDYSCSDNKLRLSVQAARYFDQRRSNLALDFRYTTRTGTVLTLRDLLRQQYGAALPPISDPRMANTLGVAALVVVREDDTFTPYLVSRSRDVAVFNCGGEWHCTASGVAELPIDKDRIQYFYRDAILKELDEEVGILEHDLDALEPVAFCREMGRAGKPQMFFLGITSLDRRTLDSKLRKARKATKAKGWVVENTPMPLLRRPRDITEADALAMFHDKGFTIEAAACLHYFLQCRANSAT